MTKSRSDLAAPTTLEPHDDDGGVRVVIETPQGSRNKYAFNPELGAFELKKVLPAGMVFPFVFGFVPSTRGGDGDPLDVLVLMDEPAFPGCLVSCRLIGVIRGRQKEPKHAREKNDRLVAIERDNHTFAAIKTLKELGPNFVDELEAFFVNYHATDDTTFELKGTGGPSDAQRILKKAIAAAK